MKKNGFTLIEMIAAVVLIALVGTVILVNMTGIKSDEEQKSLTRYEKSIEEAACTYVDMSVNSTLREACKSNSDQDICKIYLRVLIGGEPEYGSFTNEEKEARKFALIDPNYKNPDNDKTAEEEKDSIYVWVHWTIDGSTKVKECTINRV